MQTDSEVLDVSPLFYEDFAVGAGWTTASRTVTEADITAFAGLSGDYNSLHTDQEYASKTPFGQRIAHGLLMLSITSGLVARTITNQRLEKNLLGMLNINCRIPKPTFVGDTVYASVTVREKRVTSKGTSGVIGFERHLINQRGEAVLESRFDLLVRLRDPQ